MRLAAAVCMALIVAGCGAAPAPAPVAPDTAVTPQAFPTAHRPVAAIVSDRWSNEEARDRVREADRVMDYSGVTPGMTVADIGAGEGYYTIRLAQRVGPEGRVLAEDIFAATRDRLAERVAREALDSVSVKLGTPADPKLPADSFDRVFLVHMYHEIAAPYEFLWRLRPSLRPGGRVVVVDADRATQNHGTPPALLDCEMAAVGYVRVERRAMPSAGGYLAMYEARGVRPDPDAIVACEG